MSPALLNFKKALNLISLLPKEAREVGIEDMSAFLESLFSHISPESFLRLCNLLEIEISKDKQSTEYLRSVWLKIEELDISKMVSMYNTIGFK